MIVWLIGLSAKEKTIVAKYLKKKFQYKNKIIYVEGYQFRKFTDNDLGYDYKSQKINFLRMQNFCKYLYDEGLIVICSILPKFTNQLKKDKKLFKEYIEIFMNSSNQVILRKGESKRSKKKISIVEKHYKLNMNTNNVYELSSDGSIVKKYCKIEKLIKKV
jgi:adenylylsulfate kinase-like enzyme